MSIHPDRSSAQELVHQIAKDHGYLGEEKLSSIEPVLRREIEEAFLKKDLLIGDTVITLAKNLYTSKARFVFELLQNADDNNYTKARAEGDLPYVSFSIYPHQIVLECNEDGFTAENLAAICAVGKSSKKGVQGYIGEKGIGFKSVFMAAWKVHIQSGAFSFSFRHKTGQSGMGMISPIWEDANEELPSPMTKIILHLHETGDETILAKARETIQEQFEELQETVLLFMKNIRKIQVKFHDDRGHLMSSTSLSIHRPQPNRAVIKKNVVTGDSAEESTKFFHVTTYQATNLPRNENRTYSQAEEASRLFSSSQITLAFPLSQSLTPIVGPQDLFVFLPVRAVGFNFLIQADFVTDASRQDVVKDSLRNISLIDNIAHAFVTAILQFCDHSKLRYQWMRYLPDKNGANWQGLWASLVNSIADILSRTPVLYGRKRPDLRKISDLFRLVSAQLDENGEPLLDDGDHEQLLSQDYSSGDLELLKNYGLCYASMELSIFWLRKDLQRGVQCRMRQPGMSEDWHTRAAKLFSLPFENEWANSMAELRGLDLLPLESGTWVSAASGDVYFAQVNGRDIPLDLGLRLISKSVTNATRKTFFRHLGAQTASESFVRQTILQKYSSGFRGSFKNSLDHLRFLYLTEASKDDDDSQLDYSSLMVMDSKGQFCQSSNEHIYVVDRSPYGAWELFRTTDPGTNPGDGAPGFPGVKFVSDKYFEDIPSKASENQVPWKEWFHRKLHVERTVSFDHVPKGSLHPSAVYLQKHRPEKFLGALRVWADRNPDISSDFVSSLRNTKVLCRGNRKVQLKATYCLTRELEQRVKLFVQPEAFFPWLWMDEHSTPDAIPNAWLSFLTKLDVRYPSSDVHFALDMLRYSLSAFPDPVPDTSRQQLFRLYNHIQAKLSEKYSRENHDKIRTLFTEERCIYIPVPEEKSYELARPSECVWSACQNLRTKYSLEHLYSSFSWEEIPAISHTAHFFKITLGINDCTWEDYIEELKGLKASGCSDSDVITGIYQALDNLSQSIVTVDMFVDTFEHDALIYAPSENGPAWHKTSQCVWSSAARVRGRVSLNDDYGDLENLFVNRLGVKRVNLEMAIDELKEVGSKASASAGELRESIWTVNSLLAETTEPPESKTILKLRIFPVRYPSGSINLASINTSFFVADREHLEKSFGAKVRLLDFTLNDVVQLEPFMKWTGLGKLSLSNCVKEMTSQKGPAYVVSNPDRQVRKRAYAILRLASHFRSPYVTSTRDLSTFYDKLRNIQTYETQSIVSEFHLSQDGISYSAERESPSVHIDESQGGIKIYIPQQEDDQQYTFTKILPERIFKWIMTDPITQIRGNISKKGLSATKDIFSTSLSRIELAMNENGIAIINIDNLDEVVPGDATVPTTPTRDREEMGSEERNIEEGDRSSTALMGLEDSDLDLDATPTTSLTLSPVSRTSPQILQSRQLSAASLPFRGLDSQRDRPHDLYIALLGKVIAAARSMTIDQSILGTNSLRPGAPGLGYEPEYFCQAASKIERDCMIGAAGELFVFEILSNLPHPLPNFSQDNWQSTIRKLVTMHPEYANMAPWTGRETSDITYADSEGVLTNHFIETGVLPRGVWAGKRPNYSIEVKATTSVCNTPFYMSKAQYRRMQEAAASPENQSTLYVIFRVYHLGRDNMALRIYMDPEKLRLDEELDFTAETWSIVPRDDT